MDDSPHHSLLNKSHEFCLWSFIRFRTPPLRILPFPRIRKDFAFSIHELLALLSFHYFDLLRHDESFRLPETVTTMASSLSCGFLPTPSLSSLFSSSTSSASFAIPKSKSFVVQSSVQIVGAQCQLTASVEGIHSHASEMLLPAVRLSRREIIGLGAMLATTGLGVAVLTPETNAATGECVELTATPSGLGFCDTAVGSGISASKGLLIKAHYSGRLENGKIFDSSYNRGKPLVFRVGVGEVIRGWDQGILGTEGIPPMLAGGKRTLRIPSQLAYGDRGAGCRGGSCIIPPNSVLIFDVEFVGKA